MQGDTSHILSLLKLRIPNFTEPLSPASEFLLQRDCQQKQFENTFCITQLYWGVVPMFLLCSYYSIHIPPFRTSFTNRIAGKYFPHQSPFTRIPCFLISHAVDLSLLKSFCSFLSPFDSAFCKFQSFNHFAFRYLAPISGITGFHCIRC